MVSVCLWCGQEIQKVISWSDVFLLETFNKVICDGCRSHLRPIGNFICTQCGRDLSQLDSRFVKDNKCLDCLTWEEGRWKGVLARNRSLFTYNDFLRDIIAQYKFRGDAILMKGIQKDWLHLYQRWFQSIATIVPIPLSPERMYERGFNQAALLAELLERPLTYALIREQNEQKQSKKNRKERLMRATSPFVMNNRLVDSGKLKEPVLLIDDIYTTGATLRWAAFTLKENGTQDVFSMTLAHG